jgi:hypothetical protein
MGAAAGARSQSAAAERESVVSARWSMVPDPRFVELQGSLQERLGTIAKSIQPENFGSLLDPLARDVLARGFADAGAHEGTIWLPDADGTHLVPAYNSGPDAEKMVGKFRQPLNAGLICMVFASEQAIVENDVYKNSRQSKLLDQTLQVQTYALIAAPFHLLKACRGVISCVQLKRAQTPAEELTGFDFADLTTIQRTAGLLSQLIELRLLGSAIGWY